MLIGAALIAGMLIWSHGRTSLLEKYANRFSTLDKARPTLPELQQAPPEPFLAAIAWRASSCREPALPDT